MKIIRPQGFFLSDDVQLRIVMCLRTDMQMPDIARRFGVSRSAVVHVNQKFRIRDYQGRKQSWVWGVGFGVQN